MVSCWLPHTKTRKLQERKFQFKELVTKIRFWSRKAGCWRAPGGRPSFRGKRKGQVTSEAGMWPVWHKDWFWGSSSPGPSCCKFSTVSGLCSPAQKCCQLLSSSNSHSLSSASSGWRSPGKRLLYLLQHQSPVLCFQLMERSGSAALRDSILNSFLWCELHTPVEAGRGNGHMKMLTYFGKRRSNKKGDQ